MLLAERALNTLAAAVTDWSEDKSKREALVQIGRSVLIKWLLSRALDDRHSVEQTEAEHALLNLLADGEKALTIVCVPWQGVTRMVHEMLDYNYNASVLLVVQY